MLAEVVAGFRHGFRDQLLQLATGGGKTVLAGEVARRTYVEGRRKRHKGCVALYLVHRVELIHQTVNTLTNFGLGDMTGVIQGSQPLSPNAPIQVASIATLVRRLGHYPWLRPKLVFFDECHHIRAHTWERVAGGFPKAYRLGLTATPARLDDKGLGTHFQHMILGPSIPELIRAGHLCPVKTMTIPLGLDLKNLSRPKSGGDYTIRQLQGVLPKGPVIASTTHNFEKHARGRRCLNFSYSIESSRDTVAQLRGMGIRAEHVDGETDPILRDQIFNRFHRGETQFLSNVSLATEGVDVPECDCVIMSRPTASIVFYKQMAGRMMRPKADGREGLLLDLAGNVDRHGDPDADIEWSLDDGVIAASASKARKAGRTCLSCGMRFKGSECPACGEQWQGKLADEREIEAVERKSKKRQTSDGQRREINRRIIETGGDPNKLRSLAASLGYKPGVVDVWINLPHFKFQWRAQSRMWPPRRA